MFDVARHGWDNRKKCKRCYEGADLNVRFGVSPEPEEEWLKGEDI